MANMITLRSSDGKDFEANDAVAMLTERIRKLVSPTPGEPILLEDVSSNTLARVIQYFERQRQVVAVPSSPDSVLQANYPERSDSDFVRIDWVMLFQVIMLATTLGAVSILSITGKDNPSEGTTSKNLITAENVAERPDNPSEGTTSENHVTAENVAERPDNTSITRNQQAVGPKSRGLLMRWSVFIEGIIWGLLMCVAVISAFYPMTSISPGYAQNRDVFPSDDAAGEIHRVIKDFQTWHMIALTFLAILMFIINR